MIKHIMICVSGFSGVGKDEFCRALKTNWGATQIGMADAAKRHMADLYGFSEHQLFGPSKYRNAGDIRFPKHFSVEAAVALCALPPVAVKWSDQPVHQVRVEINGEAKVVALGDPAVWLSPREALQKYCEHMNGMFLDTWIRKGIEQHLSFAEGGKEYSPMRGLHEAPIQRSPKPIVTCFADFRHKHEFAAAQRSNSDTCRVVFVRIKSDRVPTPPYDHRSETEQTQIPDGQFHFIVQNNGTLSDLWQSADTMMKHLMTLPKDGSL